MASWQAGNLSGNPPGGNTFDVNGQGGAGLGRGLGQPSSSAYSTETGLNDGLPHMVT